MFGRHVPDKKLSDETDQQREERVWRKKVHVTPDGQCFIPPFALKNALESAGRWLSMKIPGEGHKTYTKRFLAGTIVVDPLLLEKPGGDPIVLDDVEGQELFVPSDGRRGGSKRVPRIFPTIAEWNTTAEIHVFDNIITEEVMHKHLEAIGMFIGFGSMRVENGGTNGRFRVASHVVKEMTESMSRGETA